MGVDLPFAPSCTSAWAMTAFCSVLRLRMGDDLPFAPSCTNAWAMTRHLLRPVPMHGR